MVVTELGDKLVELRASYEYERERVDAARQLDGYLARLSAGLTSGQLRSADLLSSAHLFRRFVALQLKAAQRGAAPITSRTREPSGATT